MGHRVDLDRLYSLYKKQKKKTVAAPVLFFLRNLNEPLPTGIKTRSCI
jgi:hypothetical protein